MRPSRSALVGPLLLVALAACTPAAGPFFGTAGLATDESASPEAKEAAKLIARSVWAVVPSAPRRKRDLRPELVRGSAVAVAPDRLLAACRVLGGAKRVGIARHGKYHLATLAGREGRDVCVLKAPRDATPLEPARRAATSGRLRAADTVYALVNRDASRLALAAVPLTGGRAAGARLATDLALPPGPLSVVLIDREGHLLGFAVPGGAKRPAGPKARQLEAALAPFR